MADKDENNVLHHLLQGKHESKQYTTIRMTKIKIIDNLKVDEDSEN